jgi:broad specificity phosphatase PhoE
MPYVYLVRHGQPDFAGNYDSITALGAQQSSALGLHYAAQPGLRFARIVTGTLQRQVDTAALIAAELPAPPAPLRDAGFNEYDHAALLRHYEDARVQAARLSGDRRAYFLALRHALQAWSRSGMAFPEGESWAQFGARVRAAVAAACAGLERDDRVLVVSSGGVIGRWTAEILGAGAEAAIQLNLQTRNTGVTECVVPGDGGTPRLVAFNGVPHLERDGRAEWITYS